MKWKIFVCTCTCACTSPCPRFPPPLVPRSLPHHARTLLSQIVQNETDRITPSYVKIPAGYPKLAQTGLTPLGGDVLNDTYVNVITGSEDYSFKLMRKNQYEEALFRCGAYTRLAVSGVCV